MGLAVGIGIGVSLGGTAMSAAFAELNTYSPGNGVVMAVPDNSLAILDPVTPANNYNGPLINTATGLFNKLTYTSASARTALVNGVLQTFAANVPRIQVINGIASYLSEPTASNIAIQCRDMTQAAWVKANATAALTATGIDNAANSASTITATAASATVLQTITQVATQDVASFWLRRRTGSGTVNITQDGVTWFPVALTAAWQRFRIAVATLTNPVIGVQIVTSGDAVDVDYTQLEAGGVATSNILTTTVAVSRAADNLFIPSTLCNLTTTGTIYAEGYYENLAATSGALVAVSDGSFGNFVDAWFPSNQFGTSGYSAAVAQGALSDAGATKPAGYVKGAVAFASADIAVCMNGRVPVTRGTNTLMTSVTKFSIGAEPLANYELNGGIKTAAFFGQRVANAQLQALTT